jgi:DNA-binding protein HU-beta
MIRNRFECVFFRFSGQFPIAQAENAAQKKRLVPYPAAQISLSKQISGVIMNTADIAGVVAAEQGIDKAAAKRVIDATLNAITAAAKKGEEVSLPGFGKFKVANRPAREGRNPATGATLTIAASKKVSFTPAKALKDALNG